MVFAICRYHLRDTVSAEDATQETFLSAHRSLLGGTEPRDPAAWLATIARNHCHRLRRAAHTAPLDEETAGTALDPADIVARRDGMSDLTGAISELPARQREAIVLRELCGLSYGQVAAAMGISGPAVESLLSRARRTLVAQVGHVPKAVQGALVVPTSLREQLARLIPELGSTEATVAAGTAGAGGIGALVGLGTAPTVVKIAAAGAAAVALGFPVHATLDREETDVGRKTESAAQAAPDREASSIDARAVIPAKATSGGAQQRTKPARAPRDEIDAEASSSGSSESSGPGSGGDRSDNSGSGSDSSGSGRDGSGSGSSDSGSSGPSSSGSSESGSDSSGSGRSGSGSSGSGSSGSGSDSSGSGSGGSDGSGSDSSGSGSGSDSSGSDSSVSGSDSSGSGSGSDSSGPSSSGSDSSGSGSGSDGSGSDSSGSGSGSDSSGSGSSG